MSEVVTLTTESFATFVAGAATPVIVDFWAAWCAPCRAVAPEVEKLSNRYGAALKVGKVDIDAEGALAERYAIRSIPTLLCFLPGNPVPLRAVGATSAEGYAAKFGLLTAG